MAKKAGLTEGDVRGNPKFQEADKALKEYQATRPEPKTNTGSTPKQNPK